MKTKKLILLLIFQFVLTGPLHADYQDEIKAQANALRAGFESKPSLSYFKEMSVIVRKADDAQFLPLAVTLIRKQLLEPMEFFVAKRFKEINDLYSQNRLSAGREIQELFKFERFFEPSQDLQRSAEGTAIASELLEIRERALEDLGGCDAETILIGIIAVRSAGLFSVKTPEEINSLREIASALQCCLEWKSELHYRRENEFRTDYEKGTLVEEAALKLVSSRSDLGEARWAGEWVYNFTGKEGTGRGVSEASFTYQRGSDEAVIAISASRISSAGRMNFPMSLNGDRKTMEIEGFPIAPVGILMEEEIELTGCRNEKKS